MKTYERYAFCKAKGLLLQAYVETTSFYVETSSSKSVEPM